MASSDKTRGVMRQNIARKTGFDVTQFISLIRTAGVERHGEIVRWLKREHGLTHGYANFIALEARGPAAESDEDAVAALFGGGKRTVLPLYERIVAVVLRFGSDVEIAPKKANVSIRRKKQFALLQTTTTSRLDSGLILKEVAPTMRLEAAGSFNAMFTHRVRITSTKDIDAQLKKWLRQ